MNFMIHPPNPCALDPQGPTISPVYSADASNGAQASAGLFGATICVPKKRLYPCVKELRKVRQRAPKKGEGGHA